MRILGITWGKSILISFDPTTGMVLNRHAWLNPNENFVGLTYDFKRDKLYALSQVLGNLYAIDPATRSVSFIGKVKGDGDDVSGLAYDASSDSLYTFVLHSDGSRRTDLASIDIRDGSVNVIGKVADGLCNSPSWRECDSQLNAYFVQGNGSWDSPIKSSIVAINPSNAQMTTMFQTPYHTIMGLARRPGSDAYFSWVNWTSHFYGEVNLSSKAVTMLAPSDPVDVISGAMIYQNFYVAAAPNLPCTGSPEENH